MEKLLTTDPKEFKRFLVGSEDPAPSEADHRQAYHYAIVSHTSIPVRQGMGCLRSHRRADGQHGTSITTRRCSRASTRERYFRSQNSRDSCDSSRSIELRGERIPWIDHSRERDSSFHCIPSQESAGYTIDRLRGPWESFEREYYVRFD